MKIHLERLDKYKKSMWGGEVFYLAKEEEYIQLEEMGFEITDGRPYRRYF